jgi:hypothetical protein
MQSHKNPPTYSLIEYRAPVFRSALQLLENGDASKLEVLSLVSKTGIDSFIAFLLHNGLANIFYDHLTKLENATTVENAIKQALRPNALADAASYLSQKSTLRKLHTALEAAGVKYAVFKGAHVRESAYEDAWLRPTQDIDVLVSPKDKEAAIEALRGAGMEYHPNPEVLSHEATLISADTAVDLHWHIMRPGRTRVDMTEYLLEDAVFDNGYWGMNPTATLFVLLTHPAINKYVCSPDATLIKMIDLCLWLKNPDIDQDKLLSLINLAGMRTAAWSTLFLINLLAKDRRYPSVFDKLKPGHLQRKYVQFWVTKDLPTRFYNSRFLMRTAFSLSLHDNANDMARAVAQLAGYRLESRRKTPDLPR